MNNRNRSILLSIAAIAIILVVHIMDYRQSEYLISSFHTVEESQQTITQVNKLGSMLKDIQRANRGYVLTGKPEFLAPYEQAAEAVPDLLSQLQNTIGNDPGNRRMLDTLTKRSFEKIAHVEQSIVKVNSGKTEEAVQGIVYGKKLFDEINVMLTEIEKTARTRTEKQRATVRELERINRLIILAGLIVSVLLLGIALYLMLTSQRRAEKLGITLDAANKDLTAFNEELQSTNEALEVSQAQLMATQSALQHREKQLLLAQRIAKTGSIEWNIKTDEVQYSEEFARLIGLPKANRGYTFRSLLERVHPDDQVSVKKTIANASSKKEAFVMEFRLVRNDEIIDVVVSAEPLYDNQKFRGFLGTLTDVSEQRRAQEELRNSEHRFRAVLEAAPDPMIICDTSGHIRIVNRQTERLFQYTRDELVGKKIEVLLPFRFRTNVIELRGTQLQHQNLTDSNLNLTVSGQKKDGKEFPMDINFSPIRTKDGVLFAAAIRDVSIQKEAEEKILKANERLARGNDALEKANQELSSFSYSISHDLRAPLRAINGYSAILSEDYQDKLDARAVKALKTIQDNANRMDALINDLLELARLGHTALTKTSVDMSQIIRATLSGKNSDDKVKVTIAPMGSAFADASLIRQVWENLISNAIKFSSKKDNPHVTIGYEAHEKEQLYYVRDNGVGFDPTYIDKLFKVFSRLHAKHEFEGTGAGLAIARKIVEAHGGKIWAESKPGEGAAFYFTLPLN